MLQERFVIIIRLRCNELRIISCCYTFFYVIFDDTSNLNRIIKNDLKTNNVKYKYKKIWTICLNLEKKSRQVFYAKYTIYSKNKSHVKIIKMGLPIYA